jgi:elongation factor P
MKINSNDIRVGNVIEHNSKLWIVAKTQHVQPGKGGAFMQVEMKGVLDGSKLNERFRAADVVEKVFLEETVCQFLYKDDDDLHLMNQDTFEQIQLPTSVLGDCIQFLSDDMLVTVCSHEGRPLSVSIPKTVVLTVVESEPVVKGQTATSSYKPAILSNGTKVMVPQHIDPGARIIVNTDDATYVERAK